MLYAICVNAADMLRQRSAAELCFQRGNKAFQHHCRLAGAGHAGDNGETSLWNVYLQRLDGVNLRGGKVNRSVCEQFFPCDAVPQLRFSFAGEEHADLRGRIFFNGRDASLSDDMAAVGSCLRPHLYDPVRLLQNLRIVIHKDDGVAVGYQIVHYAGETDDVRGMQTDGRLVQYIEDAGRAVADGACQLHPLTFAGGERGCGAV